MNAVRKSIFKIAESSLGEVKVKENEILSSECYRMMTYTSICFSV